MDIQQNKELVRLGYRFFQTGDIHALLDLFANEIQWVGMPMEFIPFSGDYHGKQEVAQFFSTLNQAQEAQRFEPQNMIAEGDKVAVIGYAQWKVRANGRSYDSPWAHVFTIRDGKIVRFQQYYDTAAGRDAFIPANATTAVAGSDASLPH